RATAVDRCVRTPLVRRADVGRAAGTVVARRRRALMTAGRRVAGLVAVARVAVVAVGILRARRMARRFVGLREQVEAEDDVAKPRVLWDVEQRQRGDQMSVPERTGLEPAAAERLAAARRRQRGAGAVVGV